MRGRRLVVGAILLSGFVIPTSSADEFCQEVNGEWGIKQCWNDGGSPSQGPKEENFWTSNAAQTMYWGLGVLGSGGAAFIGWNRVRRRRSELRTFLNDVETSYTAAKADPTTGLPRLDALRSGLQASHAAGRLDDPQFLQLDRKLADYVGRVRMLQLERAFPALPMALFSEIRTVLSDGHLSAADLSSVEKRSASLQVPADQRRALLQHLGKWSTDPKTPVLVAAPARRISVVAK